jgi:predicted negative regulator of RcsB-dependent stress response
MRGLAVVALLIAVGLMGWRFYRERTIRPLVSAAISIAALIGFASAGMMMRTVPILFVVHLALLVVAYLATLYAILYRRQLWWLVCSPAVTLLAYVVMEHLVGSGA